MSFSEEQEVARIERTMARWKVRPPVMNNWLGGMNHQLPVGGQGGAPMGQPPQAQPGVQPPPVAPPNPLVPNNVVALDAQPQPPPVVPPNPLVPNNVVALDAQPQPPPVVPPNPLVPNNAVALDPQPQPPPVAPPNPLVPNNAALDAQPPPPMAPPNPLMPNNGGAAGGVQPPIGMAQGNAPPRRVPPLPGAAARAPRVTEGQQILNSATDHERRTKAPTGAWPLDPTLGGGGNAAELGRDGGSAIIGKTTLAMTAEKLAATNTALEQGGSTLRFAASAEETWLRAAGPSLQKVQPVLNLTQGGPDETLRARRANGENVTYADCHRNAVVSAGFEFNPAEGRDCQKAVIPDNVFRPGEVTEAGKTDNLKEAIKLEPYPQNDSRTKVLGNAARFTGGVGERKARSVISAFLPKLVEETPELRQPFEAMDRLTDTVCDSAFGGLDEAFIGRTKLGDKQDEYVAGPEFADFVRRQYNRSTDELDEDERKAARRAAPNLPRALTIEEQTAVTNQMPALNREKDTMRDAKKVWTKYNLLSLCADLMKRHVGDIDKVKADLKVEISKNRAMTGVDAFINSFPYEQAAAAYDKMCKTLKINQYCEPKPGQVMSVTTPGGSDIWQEVENAQTNDERAFRRREYVAEKENVRPDQVTGAMVTRRKGEGDFPNDRETWNFHWAAVVAAKDGEYTTFENFSIEDTGAINDKQIFNAFGPDKSFFDHYKGSGFFGTSAIAMCYDKAPRG